MTPGLEVLVHEDGGDDNIAVVEVEHLAVHPDDGALGQVLFANPWP